MNEQLWKDVVKCLSDARLRDAETVVQGALAAIGAKCNDERDLSDLVRIIGCLKPSH